MARHLAYLRYIVRHKWFVFWECVRLGIVWRGLIHDWHKILLSEWIPYARYFYNPNGTPKQRRDSTGYCKPTDTGDPVFDFAWLLHQKRGRHHWQWWILPEDDGGIKILPMGEKDRLEMLADWRGAGRAQDAPDISLWYEAHSQKMQLHPDTRRWIEEMLAKGDR